MAGVGYYHFWRDETQVLMLAEGIGMRPTDILCAGIIVADHICTPIDHVPSAGELVLADRILLTIGGCAANVAVDLAKMECPAMVIGRVGGDAYGPIIAGMLRDHGVDVSGLLATPDVDTSQTLIVNVSGQDRRFVHTFGANAAFRASDIPPDRIAASKVLYLGGYLLMPNMIQEELVPVFTAARRAGAKTVLDVATPGKADYLGRLDQLLPHVDVFLPNNHEGELITGESDPVRQAEMFHRMGAATVVVTLGSDGALVVSKRERLRVGTYPIDYVDGSGGGDAFDAGYVYGLLHELNTQECLRVASALGASCVRAVGTTTGVFTRRECEEFVQKHALRIEKL
jgi:sugar/nucleoside kinase (ribokinase family)